MENKVCILLAAYNGEKYISQQFDSILNQKDVDVDIYVSVDRSEDETLNLVKEYQSTFKNIYLLPYGERFGGAGKNFYRLILDVNFSKYSYVALSDQDDIWLDDKISCAIDEILTNKVSGLSSAVTAFWAGGHQKKIDKSAKQTSHDHFFESPGPGCSFVLSKDLAIAFKTFLNEHDTLDIDYHDWLIYAFSRANNFEWYISRKSKMMYRQHENNQIGANSGFFSILRRLKMIRSGWYRCEIIKIISILNLNDNISKYIIKRTYLSNLKLIFKVTRLRRKSSEQFLLACFLFLNVF
ncbi:dTDP-rhamnosyl transferase RfbG [Shewanella benthica]|uniref:dTDP-rhamnosyl transferase RfbG n=1 Tax=Shewanella benthica TaxID=43661 RepID=A0A330M5V2_9GAMM|nr:glycosyltransferase [Shewanella benthica]SQH77482.1 dTDP-rhamnosyl transferase RfbG [Shewanella benthica]